MKCLCNLPSVDEAGVISLNLIQKHKLQLNAREEAFFIAGFQECIKWLNSGDECADEEFDAEGEWKM